MEKLSPPRVPLEIATRIMHIWYHTDPDDLRSAGASGGTVPANQRPSKQSRMVRRFRRKKKQKLFVSDGAGF